MNNSENLNFSLFQSFIAIESTYENPNGNKEAIQFIKGLLEPVGFDFFLEGEGESCQPVLIGHRPGTKSTNKIVIYGHYDVALISLASPWSIEKPFQLTKKDNRFFGRGIADNKGPLLARIEAVRRMVNENKELPEILWVIQGEEEIAHNDRIAMDIFKKYFRDFNAKVYVEETGFNDLDLETQVGFVWSKGREPSELSIWQELLEKSIASPKIEFRHLNKLNGIESCPLLSNLPNDAIYLGFGPNDKKHNIHRADESLDANYLKNHIVQFAQFLNNYALMNL